MCEGSTGTALFIAQRRPSVAVIRWRRSHLYDPHLGISLKEPPPRGAVVRARATIYAEAALDGRE